jgi:hypothetical protein
MASCENWSPSLPGVQAAVALLLLGRRRLLVLHRLRRRVATLRGVAALGRVAGLGSIALRGRVAALGRVALGRGVATVEKGLLATGSFVVARLKGRGIADFDASAG